MLVVDAIELTKKYARCPYCGSEDIGGGQGTLAIDENVFTRTCNCGYKVTVSVEQVERNRWVESNKEV